MSGSTPVGERECKHGLMPESCASCKHGPAQVDRPVVEATFHAKFEGDCPGCNFLIHVGEKVHRLSTGRYVHEGCE